MPEELKFPLHFPNCPVCGGQGVAAAVKEELLLVGRILDPNIKPVLEQVGAGILDPKLAKTQTMVVTIVTSKDVCSKCGNEWAVEVARAEMPNPLCELTQGLDIPGSKPMGLKPWQPGRN